MNDLNGFSMNICQLINSSLGTKVIQAAPGPAGAVICGDLPPEPVEKLPPRVACPPFPAKSHPQLPLTRPKDLCGQALPILSKIMRRLDYVSLIFPI